MRQRLTILTLLSMLSSLFAFGVGKGEAHLRIHLLSGAREYDSEQSLKAYAAHLQKEHAVQITASWLYDGATQLTEIKSIADADLLIVFARRLKLDPPSLAAVRQHWQQGKPVMGIRTASHAFSNEENAVFDREVLGGNYQGHLGSGKVSVINAKDQMDHPVLAGVKPFVSDKLYQAAQLADSATVLQTGAQEAVTHPVTWINNYRGGRMFYTSLGVPADFQNETFVRLLDNAVIWTTQTLSPKPTSNNTEYFLYYGTYTGKKSQGIYVSRFSSKTGQATPPQLAAKVTNPSFLAMHPNQRLLYAVSEIWGGPKQGGVTGYTLDSTTGHLTELNQQESGGAGPCHLVVDSSGQCVLVANYGGGSVAALPIDQEGNLKAASTFIQHLGSSVNPQRQKQPHAHGVYLDAANRFVFVPDLGIDQIVIYQFDPQQGKLVSNDPPFAKLKPGAGPRHFAFHPNGRFAYVINELDSTVTAFKYLGSQGVLEEMQSLSTLPEEFDGKNSTAEIVIHPSGKFVYGSNRGHDSIAVFAVDEASGKLTCVAHTSTQGKTPRSFAVDPSGQWLLAANQGTDNVVIFKIENRTGTLTPAEQVLEVGSPVCLILVPVP